MTHVIGRDLCAIDTFATACGVEEQEVRGWVQNGTLPSVKLGDQRLINVSRLQADLLSGKDAFDAGDYDHD